MLGKIREFYSKNQDKATKVEENRKTTDFRLRSLGDLLVNQFCKEFKVKGKEDIKTEIEKHPENKYIIASSHFSNLDAPAAIKSLGDIFDMQITAESSSFRRFAPQRMFLFRTGGEENFISLDYHKTNKGKSGVFNPKNFETIFERIKIGKTPWIAIHAFNEDGEMKEPKIGAIYLAQKTGTKIIPTALEIVGNSISLEGLVNIAKGILGKANGKAIFHIGQPITLEKIAKINIIEEVFCKRSEGKKITQKERDDFREVLKQLREQANLVGQKIADLLPDNQKGFFRNKESSIYNKQHHYEK